MPKFVAIINTPGHLPESEPAEFDTAQEAWQYLANERQRAEDDFEWTDPYPVPTLDDLQRMAEGYDVTETQEQTGTVYGATPGYEGSHDLGVAYSVQLAETGGDSAPRERTGITITREQIEEWVGRPVTDEIVERLSQVIPWSSIPEAINVIVTDGIDPDGGADE